MKIDNFLKKLNTAPSRCPSPERSLFSLVRKNYWHGLLLTVFMAYGATAQAQVVASSVTSVPDVGRGQDVNVTIGWTRTATATGDKITIPIPPQLTVNPPAPPAGCAYTASNMVCNVPDGSSGDTGTITFQVRGLALGGYNLTATGTSTPAASFSGTVRSTGDIIIGKARTAPAGNPVAGGAVVFKLTPQIASGDDVPADATIVVTDNLPGTATDFTLTAVTLAGPAASCNTIANANSTRTLTCTYSGPFTRAQLNASTITLTGTASNNGAFTNTASIQSGNVEYFDANPGNNDAVVNYTVDPGTDIEALGAFPSTGQIIGTAQTLVLTHKNNGPLASPAGGLVQTIVPSTFTLGTLPAGCTQAPGPLIVSGTTYNGTLVSCPVGALAVNAQQSFSLPLTMPAAPESSSFPVVVTPPPGHSDANTGNNSLLLPYQIVNPYADLSAGKSKSHTGPQAPGTVVTTTLTIRNAAASPSPATYDAAHPLRIVDYARPEEVAGGTITNVSVGWTCTVTTGVPPAFIGDANKTTRIACENPGPGSLAPNATAEVSFRSTIANVVTPITLSDRACTGSQALAALGLADTAGPQPPDGGRTGNDCADAGGALVATPVIAGKAQVSIKKESSVDNANFFDPVAPAPTLVADAGTLYWRMTITTPPRGAGAGENPDQEVIPTLTLTDNLPGILNINSTGAPAPSYKTPAITVTTSPSTWGACPNIGSGNSQLTCTFTNVPAGTTIEVKVPVSRPLASGTQTNTATLTSPNAILSAAAGGQLSDDAAVNIASRTDIALTTKTVTPTTPSVGQIVQFTITAQNLGEDNIAAGNFTITDTLFTGVPNLSTPAYEDVTVTAANPGVMDCGFSNLATGAISCTNLVTINRYNTQTITISARIKKPAGIAGAANSTLYPNATNTASVKLGVGMCEYRTETSTLPVTTSIACNDAAATSNNNKVVTFDIKVPAIDLQQGKVAVFPAGQTQFLIGDQLRYRFSVRNAGPSRAENIVLNDILAVASGFHVSMAAGMPANINGAAANSGYALVAKAVSCSQAGADDNVVCRLNADPAQSYLDAGQEVNFEVAMDMTGTANGPVVFGNKVYACADETNVYESSGKCSSDPAVAGNNLAAVNSVVFPKTDLEVVSKTAVTLSPVDIAQPIEYDIVLRNNGTSATPKMRLVDTLPTGFEWINSGAQAPRVLVSGGSAATLTAVGGALNVAASVPANGTENVCFISNGITSVTTLAQQQAITCDISGNFPPGAGNTITLKLYARAKPGLYDGSANAQYLTDRTNGARIYPGRDASGDDISVDDNPNNNEKTTNVKVQNAQVGGRTFLDLNNNGDQDGETLLTDQGIGGVTLTLTGTDKYGNPVSRTVTTSSDPAGAGSLRGDYLFANLSPSDAAGYTITQTQPTDYKDEAPQPNKARPVRNGTSIGVSGTPTVSHSASTSVISGIVLGSGARGVQFDFPVGQATNLYLSGYVYLDANNDGIKGGTEIGIAGVTVTLIGCSAGPNGVLDTSLIGAGPAACTGDDIPVNSTAVTDANGFYNFMLKESGRYSVLQQSAQPVLAGVATLRGKTTAGSVDKIASAAGTDDGGTRGTVNTTGSNAGGAPGVLQEVNGSVSTSQIRDIVISDSAARSVNNNFGEVLPGSISGFVYTEKGGTGSNYQPGVDWPFPGVTVTLTGTDDLGRPVSVTATTLADGSYSFAELAPGQPLRPGTYTVTKTNPVRTPVVVNETNGAFPGIDQNNAVQGVRNGAEEINTITLVSGAKITQANFAVLNGTDVKFKLVKTFIGPISVGQPAAYILTATNNGLTPTVGNLRFGDLLPSGMSLAATNPIVSAAGSVSNVVVAGQVVTFDFAPTTPIASGASVALTVNVMVAEAALGNVINYAVVSGGGDPFPPMAPGVGCTDANHCANVPTLVKGPPLLSLAKTGPATLILGGTDEYLLTIKNGGESPTVGVLHLIEKLPPGLGLNGTLNSPDGAIANVVSSGDVAGGLTVNFDFTPTAPLAATNGKAEINVPVTIDVETPIGVTINYASVGGGGDIRDGGLPPTPGSACTDMRCANVPATVTGAGLLSIVKVASKREAELGDMVTYTLTISNISQAVVVKPNIIDRLPQGFRLIENTTHVTGARLLRQQGAPGPVLTYSLDLIQPGKTITMTYRVRLGVGSMQGDGTNRASAQCPYNANQQCSNEARARVRVSGGVFTNDACVVGMVFVDCNGNQIKDREELGIPGVRLYVEDGTFLISDSEGKYSFCGLSPKTHVLKVDQVTLPRGSRLVSSSNRNVGDANSLFLDLKNGELQRADFIEGSCSNTVLEQVKARRTLGEVTGPQTEKKRGAALTFEGHAPNYPQQGTDSANQVIVKPRINSPAAADKAPVPTTQSERDTPLQQLEINQGGRSAQ